MEDFEEGSALFQFNPVAGDRDEMAGTIAEAEYIGQMSTALSSDDTFSFHPSFLRGLCSFEKSANPAAQHDARVRVMREMEFMMRGTYAEFDDRMEAKRAEAREESLETLLGDAFNLEVQRRRRYVMGETECVFDLSGDFNAGVRGRNRTPLSPRADDNKPELS